MTTFLGEPGKKRPLSLVSLVDDCWRIVCDALFRLGWKPLTRLAEAAVVALMQRITRGSLRVLSVGHIYSFPPVAKDDKGKQDNPNPDLSAELRVVKDSFWLRLCTMGDLGFAEAYMYGDVECDDLVSLFSMFLKNKENLSNMESSASFLFTLPQKLTSYRFLNTIGNSPSNISAHYDISNGMFSALLSSDMTYSCGIFDDLDGDLRILTPRTRSGLSGGHQLLRVGEPQEPSNVMVPEIDLQHAQERKLQHILRKANVRPGNRVLEIGSGWGSMAILITQTVPGTTVDTLTLSEQQQALAQQRIRAAGLEDRITVHLMDYRSMPREWKGSFDRVISIEMIEAVGKDFLEGYWKTVDWALKPKDAAGVVQVITIPELRFERYMAEIDFIRKWVIFPGGFLPTLTLLMKTMESGSKGRLTVDSVTNIGPHYARTLREWRRRFLEKFESHIAPALIAEHPTVMSGPRGQQELEVFKRKWIYYFCYCEVGFTTRTLGDHIMTFTREGYEDFGCDVYE